MTKRILWILPGLVTLALAGCGLIGEAEAPKAERINIAEWPTPRPTSTPVTPTPFIQITLAPTTQPTLRPATTPTPTPGATAEVTTANNLEIITQQVGSALLEKLPPVAVGFVIADRATLQQGPDASYASAGTIDKGELIGVLGTDPSGSWVYTVNASLIRGWLPLDALRITGTLEDAPVLPPDPVAAALTQILSSSSPNASSDSPTGQPVARPTSNLADLKPVATARVNSAVLNMRQRPGADYALLGTLTMDDQVTILALNRDKEWALIETADGRHGWVSMDFLETKGSLADAPQVRTLAPAENHPPDQVAPIVAITGVAATASNPGSNQLATSAASPAKPETTLSPTAGLETPAAFGSLEPVTVAHIARDEVDIRPGPGSGYAAIDSITDTQENIEVLALDQSGNWALVKPAFSETGWVAVDELAIEGSLAGAPKVFTAWVESNGVEVRNGPGIFHEVVGQLSINTLVSVLGVNQGRSWALVKPIQGEGLGWAPIRFLTVGANQADLPQAPDLPLPAPEASSQAATAPPFIPARPISESKIVFQRASGGDIMVINPDGSGLYRLTSGIDPALSPDGQTVAFTRWEGETGSLWLIGIDGSNERSPLGFIKQAKGAEWSPDGSHIVLNFQQGGRLEAKDECFNVASGGLPRPPRNASRPTVHRSEGKVFVCWTLPPDPHWALRVVNIADGSFKDIDGGTYAFRPAWDPSRSWRIISDGGRGLVEVDVNRNYRQTITNNVQDGSPVFSPDGRYLAVTVGQQGGGQGYNIHRLNADGSGRVQLTQTPLWVTAGPDEQQAWNNVAPAWSPDGSQIAFLTDRTGRWEIWVMNIDGSNQHPLFSDEVNEQLHITYDFVDERVLSWR